jgi:hypothetical protein
LESSSDVGGRKFQKKQNQYKKEVKEFRLGAKVLTTRNV